MVKTQTCLNLDSEILEKIKQMFPGQMSSLINDYLKNLINIENKDIDSINIEIETLKLKQETEQLKVLKCSIQAKEQLIQEFNNKIEKNKQEQLTKEKEEIKKATHCATCGSISTKLLKGKPICTSCFFAVAHS